MIIGFLHTAQVHVATFDALLAGTGVTAHHHVAPDLLARAQTDGVAAVRQDARYAVGRLSQANAIVCTCSTLGPLMDAHMSPPVLRIDRPAFDAAVACGPRILMVICLDSTRAPSEALLQDCAKAAKTDITPTTIICYTAWPHFEANDMAGFYASIATVVRAQCATQPYDAVVLAQASMAGAAPQLTDVGIPVFTTPQMAVTAAIALANSRA